MSDLAIGCAGIGKQYRIGQREPYRALRDTLSDVATAPFRRARAALQGGNGRPSNGAATIWALKDVSLEIRQGEVVGIIGRNGAGKSTLLKILSRITKPTCGEADIYGRVGSLLEVGTGFHPELTGRENVYLNGAILGMSKAEVARKFDEIVAFAEVENFIETPVKHYSSGMYVRLAFSVAAHLDAQVLLVDEVLAVGDARFWSKCMNKVRSLNERGVTILLVTHNMWQVQTACGRAVCLERGQIRYDGDPTDAIGYYEGLLKSEDIQGETGLQARGEASIVGFQIHSVGEWSPDGNPFPHSGVRASIAAHARPGESFRLLLRVTNAAGFPYFTVISDAFEAGEGGMIRSEASIDKLMLSPGRYLLWAALCDVDDSKQIAAAESMPLQVEGEGQATESMFWNSAEWRVQS